MKELPVWVYPDGCAIDNERLTKTQQEFKTAGVVYKPLSAIRKNHWASNL